MACSSSGMIIALAGRTRPAVDTENGNERRFVRDRL